MLPRPPAPYLNACASLQALVEQLCPTAAGAQPGHALAIAAVPFAAPDKVEADLLQLMAGAVAVLDSAGCRLVGGHSTEGTELALGELGHVGCDYARSHPWLQGRLCFGHALTPSCHARTRRLLCGWLCAT